ncbi:MAG: nucleotidyltransferase family protein [Planctomycetota bacterium]
MKPVPSSLADLLAGKPVPVEDYEGTDLRAWAEGPSSPLFLQDAARETALVALLTELAPDLLEANLHPLVKGGASLWGREYLLCGSRRVHDLDIWIPPSEEEAFTRILKSHGFGCHPRYAAMWTRGFLEIDLHTHPINSARARCFDQLFAFDAQATWMRAEPLPCCPLSPWRRPAPEDLWIHQALHAVKHEFERINLALDLHFLLQHHIPQTSLGQTLWTAVTPALEKLGLDSRLSPKPPSPLSRDLCLERPARPFLAGLRLLASMGRHPWRFWACLALGSSSTRLEAGGLGARILRILPRIR